MGHMHVALTYYKKLFYIATCTEDEGISKIKCNFAILFNQNPIWPILAAELEKNTEILKKGKVIILVFYVFSV